LLPRAGKPHSHSWKNCIMCTRLLECILSHPYTAWTCRSCQAISPTAWEQGYTYTHTKNIYIIIIVIVACSLIAPASAAAPWLRLLQLLLPDHARFFVWHILYQQNCTVELSIRIPPLSTYALMGGAISPLILGLVQFIQVSENRTGILGWGSKVTCIFNNFYSKARFWHPVSICAFYKASVTTYMYLGWLPLSVFWEL